MLVLSGRCVGLNEDGYTAKGGNYVNTYDLSVAGDDGVLVVRIPAEVLGNTSDAGKLREFGTPVQVKCIPRLRFEYGQPQAGLQAVAVRVDEPGDVAVPASASNSV